MKGLSFEDDHPKVLSALDEVNIFTLSDGAIPGHGRLLPGGLPILAIVPLGTS